MSKRFKLLKNLVLTSKLTIEDLEKSVSKLRELQAKREGIKKGTTDEPHTGICSIAISEYQMNSYIQALFKKWKHFSGKESFPVVDKKNDKSPFYQYDRLSKYTGTNGKLRFNLIKYCIRKIEKDIKKLKRKGIINVD